MRHRTLAFVVELVLVLGAADGCLRPSDGREQRDFERMRQQQRYDAYEPSRFFPNGAVLQAPPAHTVARAANDPWSGRVESAAYLSGTQNATDVIDPPLAIDSATMTAGAAQFGISCAPCHGAGGYGGGPMAPNLRAKRPPPLRMPPLSTLPAGTVFKVITNGFGRMPPYGWQMGVATRWAVVAYLRALPSAPSTAATRADSTEAAYLRALDSTRTLEGRLAVPVPPPGAARR
ncbi:MAG: c-type cytochrome [Gemmatimonadales bacterium]